MSPQPTVCDLLRLCPMVLYDCTRTDTHDSLRVRTQEEYRREYLQSEYIQKQERVEQFQYRTVSYEYHMLYYSTILIIITGFR